MHVALKIPLAFPIFFFSIDIFDKTIFLLVFLKKIYTNLYKEFVYLSI